MVCKQDIFSLRIVFPLLTSLFACTYSATVCWWRNFIVACWIDLFEFLFYDFILQEELELSPIISWLHGAIISWHQLWVPCASRRFWGIKPAASQVYFIALLEPRLHGCFSQYFLDYIFTLTIFPSCIWSFHISTLCRICKLERNCWRNFCSVCKLTIFSKIIW